MNRQRVVELLRKDWPGLLAIGLLFVLLEAIRRVFSAVSCYVDLRYNPEVFGVMHSRLRQECRDRHLWWPLRF